MHTTDDIKFFFNELRKASIIWSGRNEALADARIKKFVRISKKGKRIYKYYWKCAKCKKRYRNQADVEVDHINEIGGITAFTGDWNLVFKKMFPRPVEEHLQVLCSPCHLKKTAAYMNAGLRFERKVRDL